MGENRRTGTMLNKEAANALSVSSLVRHERAQESSQGSSRRSKMAMASAPAAATAASPKTLRRRRCRTTCANGARRRLDG